MYTRNHINKFKSTSSYTTWNIHIFLIRLKKKPHNYTCNSNFTIVFDLEEIKFENSNISENNIISVKLAKVLGLFSSYSLTLKTWQHPILAKIQAKVLTNHCQ
jgi:hypothetical protein